MRLSEAIRLGATMKPQAFTQHSIGGSCALKAAADAMSLTSAVTCIPYAELEEVFPVLSLAVACPLCPVRNDARLSNAYMMDTVWHLNDQHFWTRESIADFVELHEPLPEPASAEEHAEAAK